MNKNESVRARVKPSEKMKTKDPILTDCLRESMKRIMQQEIEQLPEQLAKLQPKDRLDIVLKLMPYVFPKVEAVKASEGEPIKWGF
jgi:hypothetical protein